MENIPRYIAVKHGEEEPDYLHPALEGILKETHGIMIYQEQVMQIAQVLAGYSARRRRPVAPRDGQEDPVGDGRAAPAIRRPARPSAASSAPRAELIFDQMAKFAGYGFNKSHAAAYALVAYQTAYLKANYPVEFLAASMTLDLGNTDKLGAFPPGTRPARHRAVAARHQPLGGRRSRSRPTRRPGKPAIRYALAAVKGVGAQAMAELVAERARSGRFRDLFDFARRLDTKSFNRRQFESLVKAGAFDCLDPNRAQSFAAAELLLRQASLAAEERESRQENLFAGIDPEFCARARHCRSSPDWPPVEKLQHEFDAIGFYLSSHPLDPYGKSLERAGILRWADLPAALAANADAPVSASPAS